MFFDTNNGIVPAIVQKNTYPRNQVSLLSYNHSCIAIHLSGATCALIEVSRLASISGIIPYSKRFSSFHDY